MPDDSRESKDRLHEADPEDPLGSEEKLTSPKIPDGVDRRTFLMRSMLISATAVITGRSISAQERADRSIGAPPPWSFLLP